jgi:two-component system chemotaxis sensor kinase CheA
MKNRIDVPNLDKEIQDMLGSFVSEGFDSLDTNEPIVEELRNNNNADSVNTIFRVFHSLKGLSGFFEMRVINHVTHEAETLLDIIRKQNLPQSEETLTVIYQTFDFLRDLLQRVNKEFTDQSGAAEAEDIILILKDCIEKVKAANEPSPQPKELDFSPEVMEKVKVEDIVPAKDEEADIELMMTNNIDSEASDDGNDVVEGLISDDMLDQFLNNAMDLIDISERNLLILEKEPQNMEVLQETFGTVHSLKGNAGFMGFSEIEEISVEMETILDSIRNHELDIEQNIITILLSNIETIRNRIENISKRVAKKKPDDEGFNNEMVMDAGIPNKHAEINNQEHITESASIVTSEHKSDIIVMKEVTLHDNKDTSTDLSKPSTPKPMNGGDAAKISSGIPPMQRKDIRVETQKIDKLFDLVGELITIETMVTRNPDLSGLILPNFNKSANMLNKITRDLQEISMSIRMMPLDGLFSKMKRLVRDVSLKMEKKVNLNISGAETEMDKNVIDEISDPLVHILRNSIDHGVELPEERKEAGKNETGTVWLGAMYEGNEILITIEDDGAGIDKNKLLKKAQEKGILKIQPELMSDKEIFALIFEPGLSTAKTITDISGRGVGMDVVKKNLEKLRGSIDVKSTAGKGTKITLRIPLTLAIMDSMLIRIGESIFALPILAIRESLRPQKEMISKTMDNLEVIKVREDIIPVCRIHDLFGIIPDSYELTKGILIIIEAHERKVCLFADEIVGQQQAVIKGLSDYIGKVPGITGCMIMGDGGIGLILDIEGLIDMTQK